MIQASDSPSPQGVVYVGATGARFEAVEVTGCTATAVSGRANAVVYQNSNSGFWANCRIHDNTLNGAGSGYAIGCSGSGVGFEGCDRQSRETGGCAMSDCGLYFLNCTLADNDTAGSHNEVSCNWDKFKNLYLINCVVKGNLYWSAGTDTALHLRDSNVGGTITGNWKTWAVTRRASP